MQLLPKKLGSELDKECCNESQEPAGDWDCGGRSRRRWRFRAGQVLGASAGRARVLRVQGVRSLATCLHQHAPEFEFGKQPDIIDRGIRDHGLTYPIAIDNEFAIWSAFDNDAWPAKYLFDAQGRLVNRWIGEGHYDEIESEIRRFLVAANPAARMPEVTPEATAFVKTGMPSYAGITGESYVGARRRERGMFKLEGDWRSDGQFVELQKGTGTIVLPFIAGEVNLVVQPGSSGKSTMKVLLDDNPVGLARGADVGSDSVARFDRSGMIRLVAGAPLKKHVLTLVTRDPGVRAYVFTFGP